MKTTATFFIALLCFVFAQSHAQTSEIKGSSEISEVTVFFDRAQVYRTASVKLNKGKNEITFRGISTNIEAQSLKVGGIGDFTILSVKYERDMSKVNLPTDAEEVAQHKKELLLYEKALLETEVKSSEEQQVFMQENKKVTFQGNTLNPEDYKAYKEIYFEEIKALRFKQLHLKRSIDSLNKLINETDLIIRKEQARVKKPDGVIKVAVRANKTLTAKLKLNYLVSGAGWYASYDLRVDDIEKPVKLVYKANVFQNTGNDWKNVNLRFSNATPSSNNSLPNMSRYTLHRNNRPAPANTYNQNKQYGRFDPSVRFVSGYVRDQETNEAIPFASIYCPESKVGTTTDINGYYTLNLPEGSRTLKVTFIGYSSQHYNIASSSMDIRMKASATTLKSVEIVTYDRTVNSRNYQSSGSYKEKKAETVVAAAPVENKTSIEFRVNIPYDIKTDNKAEIITLAEYDLNANYEYHIHPRQEQAAFLMARISNWEKYKLISGNANLYLESTYVGKTYLNTQYLKDTIDISMGKDQNIFVNRQRIKSYTRTQVLGNNRNETRAWEIKVRNARSQTIPVVMTDQVPISSDRDIKVEVLSSEGGQYNEGTGYVKYTFTLEPKATKSYTLKYKVSFPKTVYLHVD